MKVSELIERLKTIKDILKEQVDNAASPDLVETIDVVIDMLDMPIYKRPKKTGRLAKLKADRANPTPKELEEAMDALFGPWFGWLKDR